MTQQSQDLNLCDIDPELLTRFRKFRFRRAENKAALILKIDPKKRLIEVEDEVEDQTIEEIAEELPEQELQTGAKTELQMMYAGSKSNLVSKLEITKIFEVRSSSELTEQWINEKMKFFDVNP